MTKTGLFYTSYICCLLYLSSCGSYNCGEAEGIRISTIGLTRAEADSIVLRKFKKGSNFTKLVDTIVLSHNSTVFIQFPYATPDTSFMGILDDRVLIRSNYDYEIYIPSIAKLTKITDIVEPQQKMKRSFLSTDKAYCINTIESFQQDGQNVSLMPYFPEPQIYIHR